MRIVLAAAAALAPAGAFAVDYLSAEQAAKLIFPGAERFERRDIALDAPQMQRLDEQGVHARSARWSVDVAEAGGKTLGYIVVDQVIGKFELITYAVGIGQDGAVLGLEVLSYRESHGHEIRLAAWRRQFIGKTHASALRIGEDIANISGATLSCAHVTEGVRRVVALVELLRARGAL